MKNTVLSKGLFITMIGFAGICIGTTNAEAASFDDMKEQVENNDGLIYNPISKDVMNKEKSLEFIEYVEEEQAITGSEEISEEAELQAFDATKSTNVFQNELVSLPAIQSRGASYPTQTIYLDNYVNPYVSSAFSGSGWRYSGYRFSFRNVKANPYFGVKAYLDSFYLFDGIRNNVVPVSNTYVYYTSNSYGNPLSAYFATYNPVNGSRYYIY